MDQKRLYLKNPNQNSSFQRRKLKPAKSFNFLSGHSPNDVTKVPQPVADKNESNLFAVNSIYSSSATFQIPCQKSTLSLILEDKTSNISCSKRLRNNEENRNNATTNQSSNFVSNDSGCACSPEGSPQSSTNENSPNGHQTSNEQKPKRNNASNSSQTSRDVPFTQDPLAFLQDPLFSHQELCSETKLDDSESSGCPDCCECSLKDMTSFYSSMASIKGKYATLAKFNPTTQREYNSTSSLVFQGNDFFSKLLFFFRTMFLTKGPRGK